ncbi:GAD-like domain-containing protein [Nocardia sp. NPDC050697]|uniref:GAD-like domain-containing protein n=1 Tax=Nocardia sp. NPDC050697 TaxID=3155158 RepID=UPI0033CC926C
MPFSVDRITEQWGRPTSFHAAPPERFEMFAGVVPDFLLEVWRELGFSGFRKGLFWICDPVVWQPTVDEWTPDLTLPFEETRWVAVSRTAFGRLVLWGERTGLSLTVVPYSGMIFPVDKSQGMVDSFERDLQIITYFTAPLTDVLDPDGDDDRPLFKRVLKRLGPVDVDTMYGFVPASALGGAMLPENVEIVDAEVHLQILSELTPRALMGSNPYL